VRASTGTGTDHAFAFCDLLQVATLKSLRSAGCSLDAAAPVALYVAGLVVPDDLDDDEAPDDFVLVVPEKGFVVAEAVNLVDRLRVAPAATIVLRLRDIQRSVVAAAAEWSFRERPRRGRKPRQTLKGRPTGEGSREKPEPRLKKLKGRAQSPGTKARSRAHAAKKPKATPEEDPAIEAAAVGERANERDVAVTPKVIGAKAPARLLEAPPAGRTSLIARSAPRNLERQSARRRAGNNRQSYRFAQQRTPPRMTLRRAVRRRARRVQRPRRARKASTDNSDPAPPCRPSPREELCSARYNRLKELQPSADHASRFPSLGGRA
jgi:hypothetical protein